MFTSWCLQSTLTLVSRRWNFPIDGKVLLGSNNKPFLLPGNLTKPYGTPRIPRKWSFQLVFHIILISVQRVNITQHRDGPRWIKELTKHMTTFTTWHKIHQRDVITNHNQLASFSSRGERLGISLEAPGILPGGTESATRVATASKSADAVGDQRPVECGHWDRGHWERH